MTFLRATEYAGDQAGQYAFHLCFGKQTKTDYTLHGRQFDSNTEKQHKQ
jgi:hypothetical protein